MLRLFLVLFLSCRAQGFQLAASSKFWNSNLFSENSQSEIRFKQCSQYLSTNAGRRSIVQSLTYSFVSGLFPSALTAAGTELNDRLSASIVLRPNVAGLFGPPEAVPPNWLLGEWVAVLSFTGSSFPIGRSFAEFKQLLAGSVRAPADVIGSQTTIPLRWISEKTIVEDKVYNTQNYYNAFSKPITVEGVKGARTRRVAWMPILTQRGVYEKVNEVKWQGENSFDMIVKEIAPDLSVIGTTSLHGAVVSRTCSTADRTYTISELFRMTRLSQGRVKLVETGTGDTEVITEYKLQPDGTITGRHRVLVYLVPFSGPAGDLYADSQGRAIALYDWTLSMTPAV